MKNDISSEIKIFREIANIEIAPVLHCRENRITKTHIIMLYTICCVVTIFIQKKKVEIFIQKERVVQNMQKQRNTEIYQNSNVILYWYSSDKYIPLGKLIYHTQIRLSSV